MLTLLVKVKEERVTSVTTEDIATIACYLEFTNQNPVEAMVRLNSLRSGEENKMVEVDEEYLEGIKAEVEKFKKKTHGHWNDPVAFAEILKKYTNQGVTVNVIEFVDISSIAEQIYSLPTNFLHKVPTDGALLFDHDGAIVGIDSTAAGFKYEIPKAIAVEILKGRTCRISASQNHLIVEISEAGRYVIPVQ